jgi:hypothetical protein
MRELEPPEDEKESRMTWWSAHIAFVLLSAGAMGAVFTFGPYVLLAHFDARGHHYGSHSWFYTLFWGDSLWWMKARFWVGVAVGAVAAVLVWIRVGRERYIFSFSRLGRHLPRYLAKTLMYSVSNRTRLMLS